MRYFTVGPSQLHKAVWPAIESAYKKNIMSMSHRSGKFQDLFREATEDLKSLLNIPSENSIFFISSGTEGMERIIQNTVYKHSAHFVNGAFSKRFYDTALELGKKPKITQSDIGYGFNLEMQTLAKETELICFTHNETSTGVMIDLEQIYKFSAKYKDKLVALDTVSSMPYPNIDFSKIDVVFFSMQKGFGIPAGLGVLIVSPRAMEKCNYLVSKKVSVGSYHSFISLKKYADKYQTPETPNVLSIYIFGQVLKSMLTDGISNIRDEIDKKSELLEKFFKTNSKFEYLANDSKIRSKTIHVVKVSGGSAKLLKFLAEKKIVISTGYGELKEDYVRIANFPTHTKKDIQNLINNLVVS